MVTSAGHKCNLYAREKSVPKCHPFGQIGSAIVALLQSQHLEGFEQCFIGRPNLRVVARILQLGVAGYVGAEHRLNKFPRLADFAPTRLYAQRGGVGNKVVEQPLVAVQHCIHLGHGAYAVNLIAVTVGIVERVAVEHVEPRNGIVVGCHIERVEWHKHVGHNAATAIDHLAFGGGEAQRVGKVYAVGREELATGIALPDIIGIIFFASVVGLLD